MKKKKSVGASVAATVIFALLTAASAGASYVLVPENESLFWLWAVPVITGVATVISLIVSFARSASNKKIKTVESELDHEPQISENSVEESVNDVAVTDAPAEEITEEVVNEVETCEEEAKDEVKEPEMTSEENEEVKEAESEDPKVAMPTIVSDASAVAIRYRSSFMSRLIQAEAPMQDYYTTIKNYVLSYKGVKAKTSWNYESFNIGRTQCIKLNVKGKSLVINFALDPQEYNVNKYHFTDVSSDSKFKDVPMQMKVKSDRSVKYTLELVDELMKKLQVEQGDVPSVDYHMPFEANSVLAERGLVKVILPTGVKLEDLEAVKEENVGNHIDAFREI